MTGSLSSVYIAVIVCFPEDGQSAVLSPEKMTPVHLIIIVLSCLRPLAPSNIFDYHSQCKHTLTKTVIMLGTAQYLMLY